MRPFDHHIHSLLLDHDCVIVPEFGGFIASKEPARVDSVRQQAVPPRRTVAFNAYLKQNDGLLARRLVEAEHLSYPEAMQEIEGYVNRCTEDLDKGIKINIRKVGSLSKDAAQTVRFEPDTQSLLLPEAFGLPVIPAQPVRADDSGSGTKKDKRTPFKAKRPARKLRERSLIAAILIAGALAWFSLNVYLVSKEHTQRAALNPIDSALPEKSETAVPTPPVNTSKPETVFVAPPVVVPSPPVSSETPTRPDTTSVSVRTPLPVLQGKGEYYVVGGVFRVRENAEKFVAGLHAEGFTDAGVIDTSRKIFYVSYGRYDTREAAVALNETLKKKAKECWIYQRKATR